MQKWFNFPLIPPCSFPSSHSSVLQTLRSPAVDSRGLSLPVHHGHAVAQLCQPRHRSRAAHQDTGNTHARMSSAANEYKWKQWLNELKVQLQIRGTCLIQFIDSACAAVWRGALVLLAIQPPSMFSSVFWYFHVLILAELHTQASTDLHYPFIYVLLDFIFPKPADKQQMHRKKNEFPHLFWVWQWRSWVMINVWSLPAPLIHSCLCAVLWHSLHSHPKVFLSLIWASCVVKLWSHAANALWLPVRPGCSLQNQTNNLVSLQFVAALLFYLIQTASDCFCHSFTSHTHQNLSLYI